MGTLTLNGVAVNAGDVVAAADIGDLLWTPPANANGNAVSSFTFQVVDNGAGQNVDPTPNTITFKILPVNDAPVITSDAGGATAAVNVVEGTTAVTTVTLTDADVGDTHVYSIFGGADAAKFTIDAATGALSFVTAPDYEAFADAGANNVYDVIVKATDQNGVPLFDTQAIAVTVTNDPADDATNHAPVITSNGGAASNAAHGTGEYARAAGCDGDRC